MLHTLHTIVAVGGIAVFAVFLFVFLMKYAAHRLFKQGLFFTLVCYGFLHSMATKPGPGPEPEPGVTNRVEFVLGDCLVHTGGGELVQLVEQGGAAVAPEVMPVPGYRFDSWSQPFDVVTEDMVVSGNVEKLVYPIVYSDTRGAENTNPASYTVTDAFVFAPLADVEGYAFAGWDPAEVAEGTVGDLTVTAQWTEVDENPYLKTDFCEGSEGLGTISGGDKEFKALSTVKLTAKAEKGCVFAGWYCDEDGTEPAEGENDYRSTSFQYVIGYSDVKLYAKFLPVSEDYCGDIEIEDEGDVPQGLVMVDSGSLPTVTVTGLPKGLTFDKTACALVFNEAQMKAGDYAFVISAKNAGGYKNDRVVTFVYGEAAELETRYVYTVGQTVEDEVEANVTGLPTGLKCVKTTVSDETTYAISGTPTKAGRFKAKEAGEAYYILVEGAPSKYVEANAEDLPSGCKVSGSGVYAAGAKATLKATAGKGYVFAGWYEDSAFDLPAECNADYRNPTLTITDISSANDVYYPRFIELKYDYCGEIWIEEEEGVPQGVIFVESESLPTVTVTGLPKGLTFDKKTGALVFNEAQMKAGDYAFVISAKNAGGYKNDRVVEFQYQAKPTYEAWWTEYAVGQIVSEVCGPEQEELVRTVSISMKGLPAGLKLVESDEGYFLEGLPTKPGRYVVVCTYKGYAEEGGVLVTLTKTYYMTVQGAPSKYVEVVVADGPAGCKVTGSGVYAAGATIKTSATAAKNYVFSGWYAEGESEEAAVATNAFYNAYAEYLGKDGDYRLASQTWLCGKFVYEDEIVVDTVPAVLIGRFVGNDEDEMADDAISVIATDCESPIYGEDLSTTEEAEGVYGGWNVRMPGRAEMSAYTMSVVVTVDSVSAAKLTVKGAPSGITVQNYGTWAALYYDPAGKTQPKPGEYTMTLTAVNQSKQTVTRTVVVRVPNQLAIVDETDVLMNLDTSVEGHFVLTVGETLEAVYADDPEQLTLDYIETDAGTLAEAGIAISSIAVSGLPSGVTCKNGVFSGSPTKAGVYTMTFTVSYVSNGKTGKTTATAFFRAEAIDAFAVGTFNGGVIDADGNEVGTISATVSDKGKLTSCKVIDLKGKSTSITLKEQVFSDEGDYYTIFGEDKDGEEYAFEIYPPVIEEGTGTVAIGGCMNVYFPDGRRGYADLNVWSDKAYKSAEMLPNFPSKGVAPDEWDDDLELLFKPSGAVTVKRGKKSGSARFELVTYSEADGWTGNMTVNLPDGTDEGYCRTFGVAVSDDLEVSEIEDYPYTEL